MKYVFFYRRLSDIDHITPIIYSLLCSGVDPKKILYTPLDINKTTINLKMDKRIIFLMNRNIIFKQSFFNKIYIIRNKITLLNDNINNKIANKFFSLVIFLLHKLQTFYFFMRTLFIVLGCINKKIIITDDLIYNKLLKLSSFLKIITVVVPHGISLHNGEIKDKSYSLRHVLPNLLDEDFLYTYKIIYNDFLFESKKLNFKNLKNLGSARYCNEWTEVLKEIYPKIDSLFCNDKTNVLFLVEKSIIDRTIDGKIKNIVDSKKLNELIDFLSESDKYNIIIKTHPSSQDSYLNFNSKKNVLVVDTDNFYSTFQLTNFSNIIFGFKSGSICDAILLNKYFVLLDYCVVHKLVAKKFIDKINFSVSYEDTKSKLSQYSSTTLGDNSRFISEYLGSKNLNTLKRYSSFLLSLKYK